MDSRTLEVLTNHGIDSEGTVIENVYVLPGVPEIFELKLADLHKRLDEGYEFHSQAVYTLCDEGEIASLLQRIADAFPGVMVGSYIKWRAEDYRTKLTFDGTEPNDFLRQQAHLIPPGRVLCLGEGEGRRFETCLHPLPQGIDRFPFFMSQRSLLRLVAQLFNLFSKLFFFFFFQNGGLVQLGQHFFQFFGSLLADRVAQDRLRICFP